MGFHFRPTRAYLFGSYPAGREWRRYHIFACLMPSRFVSLLILLKVKAISSSSAFIRHLFPHSQHMHFHFTKVYHPTVKLRWMSSKIKFTFRCNVVLRNFFDDKRIYKVQSGGDPNRLFNKGCSWKQINRLNFCTPTWVIKPLFEIKMHLQILIALLHFALKYLARNELYFCHPSHWGELSKLTWYIIQILKKVSRLSVLFGRANVDSSPSWEWKTQTFKFTP